MKKYLESLIVFVLVLGVWVVFAWVTATLASYLPEERLVEFAGGGVAMLGLIVAIGVAARLAWKRLERKNG